MIRVDNLSYSFPQKDLYNKISFALEEGQHCAFIGASGSGKSTLIEMMMDPENYLFDGVIEIDPACRIGYVSQFSNQDETQEVTVFEYIAEKYLKLEREIALICSEMETALDLEVLLEKYQQALDAFDAIGGDDFESNINKKLSLANLIQQKDLRVLELSGGEFKLIQVIKEMLAAPDLMIMDEPDVFLDFGNLNALKNLINSYKNNLFVITHNRYLLNHCFNKIIHLENRELQEFDGRFIDYNLSLLQAKIELQELALADEEEMKRNEILIDKLRFRATELDSAANGRKLNARVKIQDRLEARRIKAPFVEIKQPEINLVAESQIQDEIVLSVQDYSLAFEEALLENVNFELQASDKVAIIGANGTGKTTLMREIFKNQHPAISIHDNVEVAYLSQSQEEILNGSNTLLEEFFEVGLQSYDEIRTYLATYGFEGEVVEQRIGDLSGGEKNILQLAKVSASKASLLLLDEPTSHLDAYAQLALEKAIENYNGAILMISHDYYTVMNCMDYVLLVEDKTIRKVSMRKFRKMIYANHFDKDYLAMEQKKKQVEMEIAKALKKTDFQGARVLSEELEALIQEL